MMNHLNNARWRRWWWLKTDGDEISCVHSLMHFFSPRYVCSRAGTRVTIRTVFRIAGLGMLAKHFCCYWVLTYRVQRCILASLPGRHCQSGRTTSPKCRVTWAKRILWVLLPTCQVRGLQVLTQVHLLAQLIHLLGHAWTRTPSRGPDAVCTAWTRTAARKNAR